VSSLGQQEGGVGTNSGLKLFEIGIPGPLKKISMNVVGVWSCDCRCSDV
jgi:hypothetical protein